LDVLDHAFTLLRAGPYFWIMLVGVVVIIAARRLLPDVSFVWIAAVITVAMDAAVALRGYTASQIAFVRYTSPMSFGLVVFLLCELLRSIDGRERDRQWTIGAVSLGATACLAGIVFSGAGLSLEYQTAPGGAALVAKAFRDDLLPLPAQVVTTPGFESAYHRALAHVDPDATISAVDRPYLIDYGRYDLPNMDLPGFAAPGASFPFLRGPEAKVARLRRAGYDTLLVTDPERDAALKPTYLAIIRALRLPSYSPLTRYYLDWEQDVEKIVRAAPGAVQQFGPLYVVDLRRAERALQRSSRP
jgi:hypothetical protein